MSLLALECFNTQPPEGGCISGITRKGTEFSFNTQPPEGGCGKSDIVILTSDLFQHTAARRRLQIRAPRRVQLKRVSTHSRPKAAAYFIFISYCNGQVSTHSRPKAAAKSAKVFISTTHSFNTQPPEGGCFHMVPANPHC